MSRIKRKRIRVLAIIVAMIFLIALAVGGWRYCDIWKISNRQNS